MRTSFWKVTASTTIAAALLLAASAPAMAARAEPGVPLALAKDFGVASLPVGGSTSMTISMTNVSGSAITAIGFTDTFPAGMVVATPNGLAQGAGCTGATVTATAGATSMSVSGLSIANTATCTIAINVTLTSAGVKVNTVGLLTTSAGSFAGPTGVITAIGPASLTKAFAPATINVGDTSVLTFAMTNPNATSPLSNVGFTDTFPAGVVVGTPNGLTGSCGGGTITATAGSGSLVLAGATLPTSGTCTFAINVTGTTAGSKVNTTSTVSSQEGGSGTAATATLTVNLPVPLMGPLTLTFLTLLMGGGALLVLRRRVTAR